MALTSAHLSAIHILATEAENLASKIEEVTNELQSDFDEWSETRQNSEAGEAMTAHIADLEAISGAITDAASDLNDIN